MPSGAFGAVYFCKFRELLDQSIEAITTLAGGGSSPSSIAGVPDHNVERRTQRCGRDRSFAHRGRPGVVITSAPTCLGRDDDSRTVPARPQTTLSLKSNPALTDRKTHGDPRNNWGKDLGDAAASCRSTVVPAGEQDPSLEAPLFSAPHVGLSSQTNFSRPGCSPLLWTA